MNKQHQFITTVSHKVNNKKNFRQLIAMGGMVICSSVYALDEQFNDALRAASSGNLALLDQYQYEMQNDALGYYPEYWKLNNNLGLQPASSIISFAQRYPQSAMAEKLAADYVEEKVKQASFTEAKPVLSYVTNPDQEESCAVAQVRAKTGDSLVFAEYKDIWLTTNTQPESCNGLGRLMLSSPLMTTQDRQQRLWGQLRAGQSGLAIATAQTIGLDLSLAQLNQIQANPLAYLWTAPKANDADYAYLIFALGRVADSDFTNALGNLQKVAQDTPQSVQKYLYRTIGYVGGTTVMKNGFNREVLNAYDQSIKKKKQFFP